MRDIGVKVGAALLATALWFHAVTELSYRKELDIPLMVEDPVTPPGQVPILLSSEPPATVRIAVFGEGKDLLRLAAQDLLLRVETPVGAPGRRLSLRLDGSAVENHSDLSLQVDEVIEPKELRLVLDHSESRRLPIQLRMGLQLAESYTQVGPPQLDTDSVDVTGPRSHLRELQAIYTDSLFRSGVRDDVDLYLPLLVPSGRRLRLQQDEVHVQIDVQELAEYEILNVPVAVVGAPPQSRAEPSRVSVRVRGGADLIGSLDPETDFGLRIDYADIGAEGGQIRSSPDLLFEVRQIVPATATVVQR